MKKLLSLVLIGIGACASTTDRKIASTDSGFSRDANVIAEVKKQQKMNGLLAGFSEDDLEMNNDSESYVFIHTDKDYKDIYNFNHHEVVTEFLSQALKQQYISSDKSGDLYVTSLYDSFDVRTGHYTINPKPLHIIDNNEKTYFTKKFDAYSYEVILQINKRDEEFALKTISMHRIFARVFSNKMGKLAILYEGPEYLGEFFLE